MGVFCGILFAEAVGLPFMAHGRCIKETALRVFRSVGSHLLLWPIFIARTMYEVLRDN